MLIIKRQEDYPGTQHSLLDHAVRIGDMLLKAFDTPTGIPYGTINLAGSGSVPPEETTITSLATAGTFSLEFGVLSRLTGDSKYEVNKFCLVPISRNGEIYNLQK